MQIRHVGFRLGGLYTLASLGQTGEAAMGTTVEKKLEALEFWNKYGLNATREVFAVSRSTLYAWRAKHRPGGRSALRDRSRAPRAPLALPQSAHAGADAGRRSPSAGAGARPPAAGDAPAARPARPETRGVSRLCARRMRGAGHHRAARARAVRVCVHGHRPAFARGAGVGAGAGHQREAAQLLERLTQAFSVPIRHVLTDNGSEFQSRFAETLARCGIVHWHTYPNCPKMNAYAERFNRTLQEDFVEGDEDLLRTDRPRFNRRLRQYLGWYNRERPHHSLGLRTPVAAMSQACVPESRMSWRNTHMCFRKYAMIRLVLALGVRWFR